MTIFAGRLVQKGAPEHVQHVDRCSLGKPVRELLLSSDLIMRNGFLADEILNVVVAYVDVLRARGALISLGHGNRGRAVAAHGCRRKHYIALSLIHI